MTAHDLYTLTLSDYKSCLCSSPALTLRSYCRERHVNYHGMCLWLSRHGISIRELRPSSSVAEDVLSEIFLTLWDKRQNLKDVKDWDSYLFITVKNRALSFLEKHRQYNLSSINQIVIEIPGNDLTPEEKLLKKDMEENMQQDIQQLPEKTRIIYCMAKEELMSYKQISEALDISERTVNTHMTNAIRKLTASLRKYFK